MVVMAGAILYGLSVVAVFFFSIFSEVVRFHWYPNEPRPSQTQRVTNALLIGLFWPVLLPVGAFVAWYRGAVRGDHHIRPR